MAKLISRIRTNLRRPIVKADKLKSLRASLKKAKERVSRGYETIRKEEVPVQTRGLIYRLEDTCRKTDKKLNPFLAHLQTDEPGSKSMQVLDKFLMFLEDLTKFVIAPVVGGLASIILFTQDVGEILSLKSDKFFEFEPIFDKQGLAGVLAFAAGFAITCLGFAVKRLFETRNVNRINNETFENRIESGIKELEERFPN